MAAEVDDELGLPNLEVEDLHRDKRRPSLAGPSGAQLALDALHPPPPAGSPSLQVAPPSPSKSSNLSSHHHYGKPAPPHAPHTSHPRPPPQIIARQPYFRWLGPTAVTPGAPYKELSVCLVGAQDRPGTSTSGAQSVPSTRAPSPTFFPNGVRLPPPETIDVLYRHMTSYLPYLDRSELDARVVEGAASEALLLVIGALAERCVFFSFITAIIFNLTML